MAANEIKIIIGGDASPMVQATQQSAAAVKDLQNTISVASAKIDSATTAIKHSFDEVATAKPAMDRIAESINAAADAAVKAGPKFDILGGRLPLDDFNKFRSSVDKLKRDISAGLKIKIESQSLIPPIPPSVPQSFKNTATGANQAAFALTNVGRVAQDLPFGFVGIQNNLNPLLESFQRLKAETGSGSAALKALGSSLIGPAGIGIALSVVSAAILIYQNGIAGFNSKTKEAKDKTEEFLKTLKSVADVAGSAAAGQSGDIAQVQALANVVKDSNNTYSERKRALQELRQINKSYFGDLKLEEGQMEILTARVNDYTKAIVAQAVLKGFTDEISRVSVELSKQDRALKGNVDEVNRLRAALANTKQSETSLTGEDRLSAKYVKAKNALDDANKAFADQLGVVDKLRSNFDDLNGSIDGAVKETLKLRDLNDPGKQKAEVDILKKRLEALEKIKAATKDATSLVGIQEAIFELQVKIAIRDQGKNQLTKDEVDKQILGYKSELQKAFDNQAIELEAITKVKFSDVIRADISFKDVESKIQKAVGFNKDIKLPTQFQIDLKFNGKEFADNAERIRQQIQEATKALFDGIVNGMQDGAGLLGEAFGNLLSGDGVMSSLATAAQGMLAIVGGILQQVGKQIVITSKLVAALKKAINSLFKPGGEVAGIAVGLALIATGSLLKNIKFDVPKLAQGGIATGPTLGIFGEAGKEAIIPLDRLPEIVGKLSMNSKSDVMLAPTFRISLTDLELGLERVRAQRRRLG